MTEGFSGFIKIEITQEHINACEAVFSYKEELQKRLEKPVYSKWCFGLLTKVSYPYTESGGCPALYTFNWSSDYCTVYIERWFEVLWSAICHCHGEEIYLSLDNYNSLCNIMSWYRDYE